MSALQPVSDLLKQIQMGELILPEFQRGYVWNRDKVKSYVESLYRRYPTGHFLIWKTYSAQRVRGNIPAIESSFSRLILDGQQRLTSVYTLFEGKPPAFYEGETLYFDLYFNMRDEEFQFYHKSKMSADPCWMAVTPFLSKGMNKFLDELGSTSTDLKALYLKHISAINRLDAIRTYSYHLDEVSDKPVEEIVWIFNCVNSSGTELSNADLALARVCVCWPEARNTLRQAKQHFSTAGFNFDLEFLTRCISAVAVGNVYFEGGFDKATAEQLKEAWHSTERVLEYLVNILRNDAYIDSSDSLKTDYVLIPMVVYLSRHGGTFQNDKDKRGFLYWMYMALMWGRYSGSTDTELQADVNALAESDVLKTLLGNILQQRGRLKVEPQDLEGQGIQSRFYAMAYVVARSRGAVDWFTGMKLYNSNIGKSYGLEDHHIFPQSLLYKNGFQKDDSRDRKKVNEIANRAFLTKKANLRASNANPSKYLPEVHAKYSHALQDQFVPMNSGLWKIEMYADFIAERRKLIANAINGFLDGIVAPVAESIPVDEQVKILIAAGESVTVEFKSSLRWDYKASAKNKGLEQIIMRAVTGFLNGQGGTVLIGVGPDHAILGLEKDYVTFSKDGNRDGYEQRLVHLFSHYFGKEFVPLIHVAFVTVDGKDICWLHVEPSHKPVYVEEENTEVRFYVRLGNTTQAMNPKETVEYISMRWSQSAKAVASVGQ